MSTSFELMSEFASVDRSNDPQFFIEILDLAKDLPGMPESRPAILSGLRVAEGQSVLDVGCGIGTDSLMFARRVGPTGRVVGVDLSELMVTEARRRAQGLGLGVSYATGDVTNLDFPDGTFDVCRVERVLEYIPDTRRALSEMIRVTRPGGRVGAFTTDLGTFVIDHPDGAMTARVVSATGAVFPHGYLGRTLRRHFVDVGLREVEVSSTLFQLTLPVLERMLVGVLLAGEEQGEFTREQSATWWDQLRARDKAGSLTGALGAFIVSGTTPG